jgi:hypothetical protein
MAASTAVLMAVIGLAIDAGYLQLMKTRMQTAADAAAIGGAQELRANGSAGLVTAGKRDASLNGFTDGANTVSVTINSPPASGYYTSDASAVEAIITQKISPLFMGLIGFGTMMVKARSVARQTGNSPECMYAMDPSSSGAFGLSGGTVVTVNCGVYVNSNSESALTVAGGSVLAATAVNLVGNYSLGGAGSTITPAPTAHVWRQTDPLAGLQAPPVGACQFTNFKLNSGTVADIPPGVYCGGMQLSGGSSGHLTGGTYILLGGGLSISGGSTLTGSDVLIFNTADSHHAYANINFNGGTTETLSANPTGQYAGILFFQDRNIAGGATSHFDGGSAQVLNGGLYFPTTAISYSGGVSASYTLLVSKQISFSGNATVNADYSSLSGGSPIRGPVAIGE